MSRAEGVFPNALRVNPWIRIERRRVLRLNVVGETMCGRFGLTCEYSVLANRFRATIDIDDPGPRFSIAPMRPAAAITQTSESRRLAQFQWGLIPRDTADPLIVNLLINARAETVDRVPAFRDSFQRQRCIIPASHFFEWRRESAVRTPYVIQRADGLPMSFAGLWASWRDPESGKELRSCAIITTTANCLMAPISDRMPVILPGDFVDLWLDPSTSDPTLLNLLRPSDQELTIHQVSPLVNNPRTQGPELLAPVLAAVG
jgi:putative SOS response-associated peptidase YedK